MPEPMNVAEIERINKLEARQRALERAVRRAKREEAGLTDPEARKVARARRRAAQTAVREFVNENSDVLRRDYWRERDTKIPSDWGTAQDNSDHLEFVEAQSGMEAKVYAQEVLGISAEAPYEIDANVEVANAINEAVYKISSEFGSLSEYGYLNGIAVMDCVHGPYAMYNRTRRMVVLNRAAVKEDALEVWGQDSLFQYEQGGWSSPSPIRSIYHELGHAVQHMYLDDNFVLREKIEALYKRAYRDILGEKTLWTMEVEVAREYAQRAKAAGFSYYGLRNSSDFYCRGDCPILLHRSSWNDYHGCDQSVVERMIRMLLPPKYQPLLEADGPFLFRAKEGLNDEEKRILREFDRVYHELNDEHIITNYEVLE